MAALTGTTADEDAEAARRREAEAERRRAEGEEESGDEGTGADGGEGRGGAAPPGHRQAFARHLDRPSHKGSDFSRRLTAEQQRRALPVFAVREELLRVVAEARDTYMSVYK